MLLDLKKLITNFAVFVYRRVCFKFKVTKAVKSEARITT